MPTGELPPEPADTPRIPSLPEEPSNDALTEGTRQPSVWRPLRRSVLPPPVLGVLVFVAALVTSVTSGLLIGELYQRATGDTSVLAELVPMALSYIPACLLIACAWRWLDREPLVLLGYKPGAKRIALGLGAGSLAGALLFGLVAMTGAALGHFSFARVDPDWPKITLCAALLLLAAHFEELLCRGYLLQAFGRKSAIVGVVTTSLLFGLLHAGNPGSQDHGLLGLLAVMGGVMGAGLLLSSLFLRASDLWLPTGVHFGWNLMQGCLLGLPVSGIRLPAVLEGRLLQPGSIASGGIFGAEASLEAIVTLLLAAAAGFVIARHHLVVPATAARPPVRPPLLPEVPLPPRNGPMDGDIT